MYYVIAILIIEITTSLAVLIDFHWTNKIVIFNVHAITLIELLSNVSTTNYISTKWLMNSEDNRTLVV